ncbi:MAG: MFS transporter [Acidaminobacteraceae bacterium]
MYEEIKNDFQIKKFCMYGFFKNLKFFEPYLLLYLLSLGYNLFTIGSLIAFREVIVYLFEVPSGIIADHYGKKKELMMCFIFYIVSFVFFFIGSFYAVLFAMLFFGLGEAFRSGTHKAMIISYLEEKNWDSEKTFVYGRTRSFSLLGSAISSLVSIILVLSIPNLRYLFLIAVIPYIADFLLIMSYPDSLDGASGKKINIKEFAALGLGHFKSLNNNMNLKNTIISSAVYDGIFRTIKDYIQPLILVLVMGSVITNLASFNQDEQSKIILGVMYFAFYMLSSQASKNIYRLTKKVSSDFLYSLSFIINALICVFLVYFIKTSMIYAIMISFLFLYLLKDVRRPLFVEISSRYMKKSERATMLSIESQIRAILMIIMGPLFGYIADSYSLEKLFTVLAIIYGVFYIYDRLITRKATK